MDPAGAKYKPPTGPLYRFKSTAPPKVSNERWPHNDDRFILQGMDNAGLRLAEADRERLLEQLCLDPVSLMWR